MSSLSIGPGCTSQAAGRTALDLSNAEIRSSFMLNGPSSMGPCGRAERGSTAPSHCAAPGSAIPNASR